MTRTRVTVCLGVSLEELLERFGEQLGESLRANAKTRQTKTGMAIQSPWFDRLGVQGCWSLASSLHLPVRWVEMRDAL